MHQDILSSYYIFNNDAYFLDFRAQEFSFWAFEFKSF